MACNWIVMSPHKILAVTQLLDSLGGRCQYPVHSWPHSEGAPYHLVLLPLYQRQQRRVNDGSWSMREISLKTSSLHRPAAFHPALRPPMGSELVPAPMSEQPPSVGISEHILSCRQGLLLCLSLCLWWAQAARDRSCFVAAASVPRPFGAEGNVGLGSWHAQGACLKAHFLWILTPAYPSHPPCCCCLSIRGSNPGVKREAYLLIV